MIELPEGKQLLQDPYYLSVEKRLTRISLYLGLAITGGAMALGKLAFACSFPVGGMLSYFNFVWMKQGVDRLLSMDVQVKTSRPSAWRILLKYFFRYALIGGTLYAIFRFRFVSLTGVLLGLFLFVAAVLIECIYQVIKSSPEDLKHGRTKFMD